MDLVRQVFLFVLNAAVPLVMVFFSFQNARHVIQPIIAPTPTPTAIPTPTPSPTPTPTPSPTPTPTPKPTATPTPTLSPTPTPSKVPQPMAQDLDGWFTTYSNQYHIDRQKLWKIAACESNLNTNARNGDYGGLYQFAAQTWQTTRTAMGLDTNPDLRFNPQESIRTAAYKMSVAGFGSWPNCGK